MTAHGTVIRAIPSSLTFVALVPAGRIFLLGQDLIRPGQDCSVGYGGRIVLSAIGKLSATEYEERVVGTIEPWGMRGVSRTHTYNVDGSIEALDGYRRVIRWGRTTPPA